MNVATVKVSLDILTAVFAILAAAAWFRAAKAPVVGASLGAYGNAALIAQVSAFNRRVSRGAAWNQVAACLAGCSALCQAASAAIEAWMG